MSEEKKTGAPDEVGGIKINWRDENMESHYANIGTATANREEFFLLFGTHQHWKGDLQQTKNVDVDLAHRIVMSPFAAKRLAMILNQSVKAYEDQFGKIGS